MNPIGWIITALLWLIVVAWLAGFDLDRILLAREERQWQRDEQRMLERLRSGAAWCEAMAAQLQEIQSLKEVEPKRVLPW